MAPYGKSPERIIPSETPSGILALHLKRYQFARKYVRDKRVLDIACGVGYGSLYLAEFSMKMIGADIDGEAIRYAKQHYCGPDNLNFVQADGIHAAFADCQFDVLCSFETIEHVPDAYLFLREVKRLLSPDGVFIVSTPVVPRSVLRPSNPYHYQEWKPADFNRLLCDYFDHVELFGQFRRETSVAHWVKRLDILKLRARLLPFWVTRGAAQLLGVRAMADLEMEDVFIARGDLRRASEIVAVASDENYRD